MRLEEKATIFAGTTIIRTPESTDGLSVHELIANCPPLDTNSLYCNLLQCLHFSDTSALAEDAQGVTGFVSGYLIPDEPETLFVWQVAVDARGRGQGLAGRLIQDILRRPHCSEVRYIKTTITPENTASWRLFEKLARQLEAETSSHVLFDEGAHFGGRHASEHQFIIGPFNNTLFNQKTNNEHSNDKR